MSLRPSNDIKMQKLMIENQSLHEKIVSLNERIVSLNERIGNLNESDLILKENKNLKENLDEELEILNELKEDKTRLQIESQEMRKQIESLQESLGKEKEKVRDLKSNCEKLEAPKKYIEQEKENLEIEYQRKTAEEKENLEIEYQKKTTEEKENLEIEYQKKTAELRQEKYDYKNEKDKDFEKLVKIWSLRFKIGIIALMLLVLILSLNCCATKFEKKSLAKQNKMLEKEYKDKEKELKKINKQINKYYICKRTFINENGNKLYKNKIYTLIKKSGDDFWLSSQIENVETLDNTNKVVYNTDFEMMTWFEPFFGKKF